ncbi:Rieske 2Fe-2S domain-containing protein [Scytonema sp. UIC 10036]|uniref:aromatic ring-hydroxylating dioxygenase subunit alpha n=1 Tax=Scytonema sp. UIC 10036 TaxID=2304196 RepID=UPI0012DA3A26|nr:Rieske 2Fe-2S domain-containing protein [Scytonema sp. UIC 10036]MUG97785.1 Rieske 2Fe-2S domain-containing protein [Scytonema sp. UIC 10036]
MNLDMNTTESTTQTAEKFNWKQCWYPVCFLQDLPKNLPYSFSLYDEPLVLFKDREGNLVCLTDRCPHRAAKLSDGQIIDGKIECLYHGWQFGTDGQCLHIPQLPVDAKIPANACVKSFKVVERQGIIWMWAGEVETALEQGIPIIPELDMPQFACVNYMRDLPYDQTLFIENVIDPAHVPISHDGVLSKKEYARPLEIEVEENTIAGILSRVKGAGKSATSWGRVDFIAPNLVLYKFSFQIKGKSCNAGTALYSIPLGKNKCRILHRNFINGLTWFINLKPRWMHHFQTNNILEGDMALLVGQNLQIHQLGESLKQIYLPLKTSDTLVIAYRKWLDKFGSSLPYYQGYSTSKNIDSHEFNNKVASLDRLLQHTQLCSSCNRAYQATIRLKQTFIGIAIVLAGTAIVADANWLQIVAVFAAFVITALATGAGRLQTKFERSYTRH